MMYWVVVFGVLIDCFSGIRNRTNVYEYSADIGKKETWRRLQYVVPALQYILLPILRAL